jgi:hypothetical protein
MARSATLVTGYIWYPSSHGSCTIDEDGYCDECGDTVPLPPSEELCAVLEPMALEHDRAITRLFFSYGVMDREMLYHIDASDTIRRSPWRTQPMYSWGDEYKHTPRCRHCGDPYSAVDEHPDTSYAGLCPGCAEAAKDANDRDARQRDDDDAVAHMRYYGG